jgi:hypothetical protein
VPQDTQNKASGASGLPHFGQTRETGAVDSGGATSTFAPQVVQNLESGGSGAPHDGQQLLAEETGCCVVDYACQYDGYDLW